MKKTHKEHGSSIALTVAARESKEQTRAKELEKALQEATRLLHVERSQFATGSRRNTISYANKVCGHAGSAQASVSTESNQIADDNTSQTKTARQLSLASGYRLQI